MVFGASVEPGILYENRFYHRDLGVDNRPDRLTAVAPGRVATLQLTTQPREGNIDAATWLCSEMQTLEGFGLLHLADALGATATAMVKAGVGMRGAVSPPGITMGFVIFLWRTRGERGTGGF